MLMWHEQDHVMGCECPPGLRVVALQAQGLVRFLRVDEVVPPHVPRANSVCLSMIWKLEPAVRLVIDSVLFGTELSTV